MSVDIFDPYKGLRIVGGRNFSPSTGGEMGEAELSEEDFKGRIHTSLIELSVKVTQIKGAVQSIERLKMRHSSNKEGSEFLLKQAEINLKKISPIHLRLTNIIKLLRTLSSSMRQTYANSRFINKLNILDNFLDTTPEQQIVTAYQERNVLMLTRISNFIDEITEQFK